ncbi:hypothetical protein [Pseudomonas protegens]|uniref:Prophage PssSM-01 n=1 Tax=Pseudomonas protegens (strain DSM 19095 / LMG 27888 / CFBP 6595 / CHA0) TaxID=1124983 RepID=A0A2C9EJP4_PSEPH|nr:hypothetical protein [Pseudomonas protegens]AGL83819.1 hypothetical protein PFLCHA0_c20380 [Pseudomonas protegens CHA0]MBP5108636.1 hypothetical protein [Pseudomonas protegens]QTU24712.1 hypothetical protein HUT21_10280 [Pseudomonas protegens]QTU34241.1 hypothetical protein HUT20_28185 [Pseudomonas protegens]RLO20608.1 hypothetical protein EAG75_27090 [Pseudomonas protegens]
MEIDIAITAKLPREQAEALLQTLRADYSAQFNEHWYDDRFRMIPEGLRHGSLLAAFPVMAAQKRLIGALKHSLGEGK